MVMNVHMHKQLIGLNVLFVSLTAKNLWYR